MMWKLFTILLLIVIGCCTLVIADPSPDVIGIYFDLDGDYYCTMTAAPFSSVVAYLLATKVTSSSGISGWEAQVWTDGAAPVAPSWTLAAGLDVDDSPDGFQVGIGTVTPLPYSPAILLATWQGFIMAPTDMIEFFISGVPGSVSFPDTPGYAAGNDAGDLRVFHVTSGDGMMLPVAGINSCEYPPPPPSREFTLNMTAENITAIDTENQIGTRYVAADNYDSLDSPAPPLPPADYVSLVFPHPEWNSPFGDDFDHDIREVYDYTNGSRTWVARIETDHPAYLVELTFNMVAHYSYNITLRNHETGTLTDIVASGYSYTYTPNPDGVNGFDIIVGEPVPPELNPSSRQLSPGWSLIAAPLIPSTNTFSSVIFDDASGATYAMAHDQATGYEIQSSSDAVEQARGYWLGTDTAFTWDLDGSRDLNEIHFPINEGWNLIGNPLWFPSHVNGIMVVSSGTEYSWGDAVAAGIISDELLTWDGAGSTYTGTLELNAWNGYWLACYEPNVELVFHYENMPMPTQLRWLPFAQSHDEDNWKLDVSVVGTNQRLTLGTCVRSSDGFDAYLDRPRAPRAPNSQIEAELVFDHPEWDLTTGSKIMQDIRSPYDTSAQTWNAILSSPESGNITLDWSRSVWGGTRDLQVYLPDQNRVVVASMRSTARVTLAVGEEPVRIQFRTPSTATGVDEIPILVSTLNAVPNPFNPQTEIRYTTATDAACGIRIYDVAGRLVRSLDGVTLAAGDQASVTWYGRDESGREVASGTYFARLIINDRSSGVIRKLSLVR